MIFKHHVFIYNKIIIKQSIIECVASYEDIYFQYFSTEVI